MIVGFTGHRPQKLGGFTPGNATEMAIRAALKAWLVEHKPTSAISGMALGVDQWAAEICIAIGVPFVAAIPFSGQESQWPSESRDRYVSLLSKASRGVIVSEGGYAVWKMQKRNEWIVDNCDVLLAVWDGSSGGTGNCVRYAKERGKKIEVIDPRRMVVGGDRQASLF